MGMFTTKHVARGTTHQLACLGPVVEAHVEALDAGEEPLTQHRLGEAALPEGDVPTPPGEHSGDDGRGEDERRPEQERTALLDSAVDRQSGELGHGHLAECPHQTDRRAEQQGAALRT